jgi:hypothetical protein
VLDYRTAISATEITIHRRAALFRYQAIGVVLLIGLTLLYSLIAGEWRALLALLFLVPMCGAFFIADGRAVDRWRHQLLSGWTAKEIDFAAFREAMRALPRLPRGTLDGMLQTLPAAGDLVYEQTIQSATRQAIAATCVASHALESDALLLKVLASTIIAAVTLAAVWARNWQPLIGALALVMLPAARAWLRRHRRTTCEAKVAACRVLPDFNETGYDRVRARSH